MIENIHVLRAVAAYMVVFYHGQDLTQAVSPAFDYVHAGAAGVDIFFVISGFVITHTNLRNQKATTQFWLDRIIRIVPLYWAVTFFLILVSLSGWRPTGLHHWDAGDLLGS
ncbi:MAG: acyltransferase, partial [Chitinophagales bacterium]|nr:acyltransferase [Hyphomicrobiales bacterium]